MNYYQILDTLLEAKILKWDVIKLIAKNNWFPKFGVRKRGIVMAKYRKRPVIVEAEQYKKGMEDGFDDGKPYINTLEGKHYITPGDYIITGIEGERYPCKAHIFHKTYEYVWPVTKDTHDHKPPTYIDYLCEEYEKRVSGQRDSDSPETTQKS